MKQATDPRHLFRIKIVQELFAQSFNPQQPKDKKTKSIIDSYSTIDKLIEKAAPEWALPKIAKIDLAILRLATYEIVVDRQEPVKVIIDEAVEIAKEFGNDRSSSFINGVLGTILKSVAK